MLPVANPRELAPTSSKGGHSFSKIGLNQRFLTSVKEIFILLKQWYIWGSDGCPYVEVMLPVWVMPIQCARLHFIVFLLKFHVRDQCFKIFSVHPSVRCLDDKFCIVVYFGLL